MDFVLFGAFGGWFDGSGGSSRIRGGFQVGLKFEEGSAQTTFF